MTTSVWSQSMTNQKLAEIFVSYADSISGEIGSWQIYLADRPMLCFTDSIHDRMRIISPIVETGAMTEEEKDACLEANFHSALDVKYAISDDILWSIFVHPLGSLSTEQVESALRQVYNAAETYGDSYSSMELVFPKSRKKTNEKPKLKKS